MGPVYRTGVKRKSVSFLLLLVLAWTLISYPYLWFGLGGGNTLASTNRAVRQKPVRRSYGEPIL